MTDKLCDLSAGEMQGLYETKQASPVEVLEAVLHRIERLDPTVNAFCQINADALDMARASDDRWRRGAPLSPLDGVPVSIKDNVAIKGVATRFGSLTTSDTPSAQDSPCVARLREAGAICVGKTNLPDFAHKIVTDSSLTGVTLNPWDTERTPGGSSGGAAAAVSLGMAPVAIGTDGGGSIRIPAAFTGIFGFKPSFGRVPHAPRGPFGLLSHVGPMTRCVADAARILSVISRPDTRDWYALPFDANDYALDLKRRPHAKPRGLRIAGSLALGLPLTPQAEIQDAVRRATEALREQGNFVRFEDPPGIERCNSLHSTLWPACCRQLTEDMADDKIAMLAPSLQAYALVGDQISRYSLLRALIERGDVGATINAFFERYDILICPVYPRTAMRLAELSGEEALFPYFTAWCNQIGLPAASLYAGLTSEGLPIGIQIVGGRHADASVLWVSQLLESTFGQAPLTQMTQSLANSLAARVAP